MIISLIKLQRKTYSYRAQNLKPSSTILKNVQSHTFKEAEKNLNIYKNHKELISVGSARRTEFTWHFKSKRKNWVNVELAQALRIFLVDQKRPMEHFAKTFHRHVRLGPFVRVTSRKAMPCWWGSLLCAVVRAGFDSWDWDPSGSLSFLQFNSAHSSLYRLPVTFDSRSFFLGRNCYFFINANCYTANCQIKYFALSLTLSRS